MSSAEECGLYVLTKRGVFEDFLEDVVFVDLNRLGGEDSSDMCTASSICAGMSIARGAA